MRDFLRATGGNVSNVPPLPGIFPDYSMFATVPRDAKS
jgi:hypothetical protein